MWRTPPSSSQPSTSTSISCDNLQTEDQLASPPPYPRPGLCSPPALPRPPQGPSCRRPRQSVIPLALLSALGRSGQIKPLSHIPRKAQGQMGQDKWCQIIDLLLAWTQGRARLQHCIWLWEEERGPRVGAATQKRDDTPWPSWRPEPMQGTLVQLLDDPIPTPLLS